MKISKYFKRSEFECKCKKCGFDVVDVELLAVLEDVRENFGKPLYINSGCRCLYHNKSVGGSENSQHVLGKAADIRVKDVSSDDVHAYLVEKYPDKYGIGKYQGRTHVDVRSEKTRWEV